MPVILKSYDEQCPYPFPEFMNKSPHIVLLIH
jgi:hypothetical protein